jgi:hypothetical protein
VRRKLKATVELLARTAFIFEVPVSNTGHETNVAKLSGFPRTPQKTSGTILQIRPRFLFERLPHLLSTNYPLIRRYAVNRMETLNSKLYILLTVHRDTHT